MRSKWFWLEAIERAVKTFVQVVIALWLADRWDILGVDWGTSFVVASIAAVLSVLTSILSTLVGSRVSPSLVR